MRKVLFIVTIIFLGGLGLFSQGYTPVTFTADDEDYVWGNVHVGDIIEFNQPNNAGGSPTKIGIVFYINPEKTEGWAVELTNTSNGIKWLSSMNLIDIPTIPTAQVGNLLSDVDGYNNTSIIRQYYGLAPGMNGNYAAGVVDFKNKWYLPAAGQLMKLYGVLTLLEQGAAATGFTTLARGTSVGNARYWSSTQCSAAQAWYVQGWNSASSGGNLASYSKGQAMSVRAVRTFKLKPSKLTYLWSPTGDTVPEIKVCPNYTTEYCVTVRYGDLQCTAEVCHTIEVNPTIAGNDYMTICENELPFEWNGVIFTEAGTQTCSIPSSMSGCDSIVHLHLSVNPNLYGDYYSTICESELPYTWHGVTFTEAGEETVTVEGATTQGCDSIVTLHVTVNPTQYGDYYSTICESELPYTWHGVTFTEAGEETITIEGATAQGCDSIVTLHLTINNSSEEEEYYVTECDSYTWNEQTYYSSGSYTQQFTSVQGCDSIVTLHLTIGETVHVEWYAEACNSYTWNGDTYTESGDYEQTLTTAQGCDSIVTLHLTINEAVYNAWYAEACDQYNWYGQTYLVSGDYTQQFTSVQGCDSIVFLHLTINDVVYNEWYAESCNSYTWNGETYTESGDYEQTLTTAQGCDSIVILHLTINDVIYNDWYVEACYDSYTWNGQTYNTSGDYTQQFISAQGCDSIVTLHLNINQIVENYFTETVCDSYTWNGQTYNTSGNYTQQFTSVQGCDSIVTLQLTVNYSEEGETTLSACDSYTWADGNGQTYTASGDYTWNTTTAQGCDKTVTLHLTINNSEWEEYSDTVCDSYTWALGNGQTYTESGDYVWNTTTAQGCDKNVTLHLTINNSEWEEYTVTASDSYTWYGTTYTQSGTYHYETTTAQGCSRTEILHLTIDGNHWTPVADGQYPFAMTLYGVISIDGVEQTNNQLELGVFCGNECRGTAMASEFFLTHRYLAEVNVYGDSGEQLTFKLYNHATHQELDLTPPAPITFTIDGYGNPINPYMLNFISSVNITATTAPEGAGTVTGTGEYTIGSTCTLTATANTGFQFQNWTLNGTVVSTSPNYTFTVTGAANYVAHFQYVQSRTLVAGWNWWSTYIEQNGSNGLEMLENSLGTSGIRIQGKNNSVDYFEYQGTGYWYGSLNTLTNEQMYMIRTSAACDAVILGDAALPSNHPITINGGWNWIGFPCSQSVSVDATMAGFMPEPNDVIKGRSSASMYLSYGGYQGWYGQLNTLEPGQGYMYRSYSDATKTLRFQTGRGGETLANITSDNNVFVPNTANYADNMIVTAVIDMEGVELRSEDYELAAFAGNECRGSVKLMYVEPYDRYVALLMAYGEGGEELRFVLTDGEGTSWSNDRVTYTANGMLGTMTEPTVLHFGPMCTKDNLQKPIHVYPNPSKGIFNIEGEGIQKIEVVDIYGQVILSSEVKNTHIQVDLSEKASGAYLLRVVSDSGTVTHKLVNRK